MATIDKDEIPHSAQGRTSADRAEPLLPAPILSARERQVAHLFARDCSTKVIAYELGIADSTVRVLLRRVRLRFQASDRKHLLAKLTVLPAADGGHDAFLQRTAAQG
jgi:DNA-binding CsgD family transcriptional regulator